MTTTRRLAVAAISFALAAMPSLGPAQESTPSLSPDQAAAVNKLIHDYLMNNPKVVIEAIEHADAASKADEIEAQKQQIRDHREELDHDPTSPVLGNPQGDVTVVEFFDFRCPYCKVTAPAVEQLIEHDSNVRLVMKDFPILGDESTFASRVALVAQAHGKYGEFFKAMFDQKGEINDVVTLDVAKSIGLDTELVKKEMESEQLDTILKNNLDLAKAVGAEGTPAFIIADNLQAGTITTDQLEAQVKEIRLKNQKKG
jgi:protein-disulfide isomerase